MYVVSALYQICRAAARPMPATATPSEVELLYVTPLMVLVPLPSESR